MLREECTRRKVWKFTSLLFWNNLIKHVCIRANHKNAVKVELRIRKAISSRHLPLFMRKVEKQIPYILHIFWVYFILLIVSLCPWSFFAYSFCLFQGTWNWWLEAHKQQQQMKGKNNFISRVERTRKGDKKGFLHLSILFDSLSARNTEKCPMCYSWGEIYSFDGIVVRWNSPFLIKYSLVETHKEQKWIIIRSVLSSIPLPLRSLHLEFIISMFFYTITLFMIPFISSLFSFRISYFLTISNNSFPNKIYHAHTLTMQTI